MTILIAVVPTLSMSIHVNALMKPQEGPYVYTYITVLKQFNEMYDNFSRLLLVVKDVYSSIWFSCLKIL